MKKEKKSTALSASKIRPGAYIEDYDIDNRLLDTVDSADDAFTQKIPRKGKKANPASPSAGDPPVPNSAHTEM